VHHDRCLLSCNLGRYGPIATRIELNHNVAAAKQHQKKSENKYHPELVFRSEQINTSFLKKSCQDPTYYHKTVNFIKKADQLWQKEARIRKET